MSKMDFDLEMYLANKSEIASAFCAVENSLDMTDEDKDIVRRCLLRDNSNLDEWKSDASDPDVVIPQRLVSSFKFWDMMNYLESVIKDLQRIESYCKEEDYESLHATRVLLAEFDKDINEEIPTM